MIFFILPLKWTSVRTHLIFYYSIDLLKLGDESDGEDKKKALAYLEEGLKKKEELLGKTLVGLTDRITKEELCNRLRDTFFKSYVLRLALVGKKVTKTHTATKGPSEAP